MSKLYLHDQEVSYVGTGPFGTFVRDKLRTWVVFGHGAAVHGCLGPVPIRPTTFDCPNCDWTAMPVYKCGGSCQMRFNHAGCE